MVHRKHHNFTKKRLVERRNQKSSPKLHNPIQKSIRKQTSNAKFECYIFFALLLILVTVNKRGYVLNQYFLNDQWYKKFLLRGLITLICLGIGFSLSLIGANIFTNGAEWAYFVLVKG